MTTFLKNAFWVVIFLAAFSLWGIGLVGFGLQRKDIVTGLTIILLGSCVFSLWLGKNLQPDQRKKVLLWVIFQIFAPLLPIVLSVILTLFQGDSLHWDKIVTGTETYIYTTYLGVAAIGALVEDGLRKPGKDSPIVLFSTIFLITFLAAMTTGVLIRGTPLPIKDEQTANTMKQLFILAVLIYILPANVAAKIACL